MLLRTLELKTLASLDQALELLGQPCEQCQSLSWSGIYIYAIRKNDIAIYRCSLGTGHELEAKIDFKLSLEQLVETLEEINQVVKKKASEEELNPLFTKLETSALFISPEIKFRTESYCPGCSKQVPIRIKSNQLKYYCTHHSSAESENTFPLQCY